LPIIDAEHDPPGSLPSSSGSPFSMSISSKLCRLAVLKMSRDNALSLGHRWVKGLPGRKWFLLVCKLREFELINFQLWDVDSPFVTAIPVLFKHLWSVMRCHIRPSMTCWKQAPSMTESEALQILLGFLQVSLEGIVAVILQQLWRKKLIEHAYPWNFWLRRWHLRDLLLCGWVDLCSGSLCLLRGAHSIERWGLEVHDSDSAVVGVLGCREVSMSMIDGFGMLQHWGQRGQEAFGQEKAVLVHASRYL